MLSPMTLASLSSAAITAGLLLQLGLAGALVWRRVWEKFPLFTAYALFNLLENSVSYVIPPHSPLRFYWYAVGEAVSIALGLAVVREIFTHMFSLYPGLRKLATISFRVVLALLVVLGFFVIYARGPFDKSNVAVALFVMEEAARVLEVGLITFLFIFSGVFGLHWRQAVFGIALGLGVFAAVKLGAIAIGLRVAHTGMRMNVAQLISFDISLLLWLGYLLVPERVTSTAALPQRAQLEQWNQAIMELIHQ